MTNNYTIIFIIPLLLDITTEPNAPDLSKTVQLLRGREGKGKGKEGKEEQRGNIVHGN